MDTVHSGKFRGNCEWLSEFVRSKLDKIKQMSDVEQERRDYIVSKINRASQTIEKSKGCQLIETLKGKTLEKWIDTFEIKDDEAVEKLDHFSPSEELTDVVRLLLDHDIFVGEEIEWIVGSFRSFIKFSILHYHSLFLKGKETGTLFNDSRTYVTDIESLMKAYTAFEDSRPKKPTS
jgi:hypothetical protein